MNSTLMTDQIKTLVSLMTQVRDKTCVEVRNKSLMEFVQTYGLSGPEFDEVLASALATKGFDKGKPFTTTLNQETRIVTYSQKNDSDLLLDKICEAYDITTDMGRLALKEALKNLNLFDRKQRDYGSGNIADFGEMGVLIRLNDKINRLKNLLKSQASANFESVSDTWDDISNYGLIGKLCNLKLWK
jgi:hypothetical protein